MWRTHFNVAWVFLLNQEDNEHWNLSDFAWASTQSLYLVNIVNKTSIKHHQEASSGQYQRLRLVHETPTSFVSSTPSFGFTIGATQLLMTCIMGIRKLACDIEEEGDVNIIDDAVNDLYSRLEACRESQVKGHTTNEIDYVAISKEDRIAWYHLNAFIAAARIYLHRTIFDLPPGSDIIKNYVGEVFENVESFLKAGGGNFSLWPAFIALLKRMKFSI